MPGRQQIPSFQLARGSTNERDTQTEVGSIFYNTDTSNVEVYHEDLSNNVGWRDLVMNNKEQIDISGNVDISGTITCATAPTTGSELCNKSYVDSFSSTPMFGIDFFARAYNNVGNLNGLQKLAGVGPQIDTPNAIYFVNLPFTFKIIGMTFSIDSDNGSGYDYDWQIITRPANTGVMQTLQDGSAGDVISFDDVVSNYSYSALFTDPQTIVTGTKEIGLNLATNASGNASPEYIVKLWCQVV